MKKTAWVTGAARGIGAGIAKVLTEKGWQVIASDMNLPTEPIEGVDYVQANVTVQEDTDRVLAGILKKYGSIDLLVNNAGVAPKVRADLLQMTPESFDFVLGVNLKGMFFLTQTVARQMEKQKSGCIVNVSSCSAEVVSINRGEYCMSKAGASMATKLFAVRLAPLGINVYEIRPGIIDTPMTSTVHEKYDRLIDGGLLPIQRWGTPEDIGRAVALLASGELPYVTGDVLNLDGGMHLPRL